MELPLLVQLVAWPRCFNLLVLLPMLLVRALGDTTPMTNADHATTGVLALGIRRTGSAAEVVVTLESQRDALERLISTHSGCAGVEITRVKAARFARVDAIGDDESVAELFLVDFRVSVLFRADVDDVGLRRSITRVLDGTGETGAQLSVEDVSVEWNQNTLQNEEHSGSHVLPLAISAVFGTFVLICCVARIAVRRKVLCNVASEDIERGLEKQNAFPMPSADAFPMPSAECRQLGSLVDSLAEMQLDPQASNSDALEQSCSSRTEASARAEITQDADATSPMHAPCSEAASDSSDSDLTADNLGEAHADDVDTCSSENTPRKQQEEEVSKIDEHTVAKVECSREEDALQHTSVPKSMENATVDIVCAHHLEMTLDKSSLPDGLLSL